MNNAPSLVNSRRSALDAVSNIAVIAVITLGHAVKSRSEARAVPASVSERKLFIGVILVACISWLDAGLKNTCYLLEHNWVNSWLTQISSNFSSVRIEPWVFLDTVDPCSNWSFKGPARFVTFFTFDIAESFYALLPAVCVVDLGVSDSLSVEHLCRLKEQLEKWKMISFTLIVAHSSCQHCCPRSRGVQDGGPSNCILVFKPSLHLIENFIRCQSPSCQSFLQAASHSARPVFAGSLHFHCPFKIGFCAFRDSRAAMQSKEDLFIWAFWL